MLVAMSRTPPAELETSLDISDKVAVMYLGRIVEFASTEDLFARPSHPYTQALLSAVPRAFVGARKERIILQGDVPSPMNPPPGCHFHTRCPQATERCRVESPVSTQLSPSDSVTCHLHSER